MAHKLLLVAILLLLVVPPAVALNCTKYTGDYRTLCSIVNPLPVGEEYRKSLMKPDVYGRFEPKNQTPNLQLQEQSMPVSTLKTLYEEKIVFVGRVALFILFHYMLYSLVTKSSTIRKWLTAVF